MGKIYIIEKLLPQESEFCHSHQSFDKKISFIFSLKEVRLKLSQSRSILSFSTFSLLHIISNIDQDIFKHNEPKISSKQIMKIMMMIMITTMTITITMTKKVTDND